MIKSVNLFIILSFLIIHSANGQLKKPGISIGAGVFYANPKGEFAKMYKGGLGAEAKGGIGFGKTYVMASLGYAAFATQPGDNSGTLTYAPIKAGIKQYLLAKRLFINGDVGVAKIKDKTMSAAESRFTADIGAGIRLLGIEAGMYYDTFKSSNDLKSNYSTSVLYKIGYNITL